MSAKAHMARLHELPCLICKFKLDAVQETATVCHHLESVRDEYSDYCAVPLCDFHHRQLHQLSRQGFERLWKLTPIDLLGLTIKLLEAA